MQSLFLSILFLKAAVCPRETLPDGMKRDTESVTHGSKVTYSCIHGYISNGKSGVSECIAGIWTAHLMTCTGKTSQNWKDQSALEVCMYMRCKLSWLMRMVFEMVCVGVTVGVSKSFLDVCLQDILVYFVLQLDLDTVYSTQPAFFWIISIYGLYHD